VLDRRQFLRAAPAALAALGAAPVLHVGKSAEAAPAPPIPLPAPPSLGFSSRSSDIGALKPTLVTAASPKLCKVLQFTDLHFFRLTSAEDERTLDDCQRMIARCQPDLVVATGDIWHENPEGKGQSRLEFTVERFCRWGVPWTICWGNHDLLDDYQKGHDLLASARHSVYGGAATHGDYRVEVRPAGVPPQAAPALDVFFLNSHDQGLSAWQVRALRQMTAQAQAARPKAVPALLFFHVPILEYNTRLGPETFKGLKLEGVGSYKEDGVAFPAISAAKSIRACFCGHSHTNDYAVKAGNVDLHYGRSTGYAGYGGEVVRKGGKLIEVDLAAGNYRQTTVFADGAKEFA